MQRSTIAAPIKQTNKQSNLCGKSALRKMGTLQPCGDDRRKRHSLTQLESSLSRGCARTERGELLGEEMTVHVPNLSGTGKETSICIVATPVQVAGCLSGARFAMFVHQPWQVFFLRVWMGTQAFRVFQILLPVHIDWFSARITFFTIVICLHLDTVSGCP